jgi:hypothetical protein
VDFSEITARKTRVLCQSKLFAESVLGIYGILSILNVTFIHKYLGKGGCELYTDSYCLLSGDLRQFESSIVPELIKHGFDSR